MDVRFWGRSQLKGKRIATRIFVALLAAAMLYILCACTGPHRGQSDNIEAYNSDYKTIPGVTQEEIKAIDALRGQHSMLTLGVMIGNEAFVYEDGSLGGFSPALCRLFSDMFGIPFELAFYDWADIIPALNDRTLHFAGELSATEERRKQFIMTEPVCNRTIKVFTNRDADSLNKLAQTRSLRFAFLEGVTTENQVLSTTKYEAESVYVDDYDEVINLLLGEEIDAFFEESAAAYYFDDYASIKIDDYFPLIYSPVSITTASEECASVISVVDKYLANGGDLFLVGMYADGNKEYLKHKLRSSFTPQENDYVFQLRQSGKNIGVAADPDNYPISFYNDKEQRFEGVAIDVLKEITKLTNIEFEPINARDESLPVLMERTRSGEAALISALSYTGGNEGFLLAAESYAYDQCALLAVAESPDVELNEILFHKVGLIKGSIYGDTYLNWFPLSENYIEYETSEKAFKALERGEVDFVMASQNLLLSQTNFREEPGFKTAIIFDHQLAYAFGFNEEENLLCSIIDKIQPSIDTNTINQHWSSKTFNYRNKLLRDTMPFLLIGIGGLTAAMVALVISRRKNVELGKNLELLVHRRTSELEAQTATLTTMLSSMPDLVFCKDVFGRFTLCNDNLERFFNMKKEDIVGKTNAELFYDPDSGELQYESVDGYESVERNVLETREVAVVEETVYSPYLEANRLFETIKAPLIQNGEVTGLMGIARDITQRKATEEAALAASREKSDFLARMSHEIRTPLNAIIGMTHVAKMSIEDTEKVLHSIDEIFTASEHLRGIINDVLDMSKIESGKFEIANEPFGLIEAISEISSIVKQRCKEKYIAFQSNISELPNTYLAGDKLRLNQVLLNLLGNAVKFTPENGRIDFNVDVLEETEKDVTICFTLTDSGIGMAEEQMQRLFVAFEQADKSIATRFGGTGLGLAISQNLVNLMGGKIIVESKVNEGSSFRFTLVFPKASLHTKTLPSESLSQLDLTGKRVLLAEDIDINRTIIHELLSPTHLDIDEAVNGQEAVDLFSASPVGHYDLIFMDIQMPEMDGYEAVQCIRSLHREDAKTVPIVAMTANAYREDINKALAVGMNGHIAKPVDLAVLMRTLAESLGGAQ